MEFAEVGAKLIVAGILAVAVLAPFFDDASQASSSASTEAAAPGLHFVPLQNATQESVSPCHTLDPDVSCDPVEEEERPSGKHGRR